MISCLRSLEAEAREALMAVPCLSGEVGEGGGAGTRLKGRGEGGDPYPFRAPVSPSPIRAGGAGFSSRPVRRGQGGPEGVGGSKLSGFLGHL